MERLKKILVSWQLAAFFFLTALIMSVVGWIRIIEGCH